MRVIITGPSGWNRIKIKKKSQSNLALKWIDTQLELLSIQDQIEVGTSLHLGLDNDLAMICKNKGIPYHVILSCIDQDKFWDEENQIIFHELLKYAKEVNTPQKEFYEGCIKEQRKEINNWFQQEKRILLVIQYGQLTNQQRKRIQLVEQQDIRKFCL